MTVLRIDAAHGACIHTALWPISAVTTDTDLDIGDQPAAPRDIPGLPGLAAEPATFDRGIYITRDGRDLCAHPAQRQAFLRDRGEGRFAFLLVSAGDLAVLRALLSGGWQEGTSDVFILAGEAFTIDLGGEQVDIRDRMPRLVGTAPDRVAVGGRVLSRTGLVRDMLALVPRPAWLQPPFAEDAEEWRRLRNAQWIVRGEEEVVRLPLTVSDADWRWFYGKPFMQADHRSGRMSCDPRIVHESGKYVMMARHAEGVVFGDDGVCSEAGYLRVLGPVRGVEAPPGMWCDDKRCLIDRQVLALAPALEGAYAVFTPATLTNYTHWLIDGLLVLHCMLPYLPEGTRLLLPATLRGLEACGQGMRRHRETLRAFGFDHLPVTEVAAPYCRVAEAYWMVDCHISNMPADQLRSLRARALGRRAPPPRAGKRIHIGRRSVRRIVNAPAYEAFLAEQGFATYHTEDLSIDAQIDLFAQAEWVIAPHGAGLGNLLFCPSGTKIIDIMPDIHFQPYFSYMCSKLDLVYGVLPCPTHDGGVNGDMIVDTRRLRALFCMMTARQ